MGQHHTLGRRCRAHGGSRSVSKFNDPHRSCHLGMRTALTVRRRVDLGGQPNTGVRRVHSGGLKRQRNFDRRRLSRSDDDAVAAFGSRVSSLVANVGADGGHRDPTVGPGQVRHPHRGRRQGQGRMARRGMAFASSMPHVALHLHIGMDQKALLPVESLFHIGAIVAKPLCCGPWRSPTGYLSHGPTIRTRRSGANRYDLGFSMRVWPRWRTSSS
jgi:hypothetical protein